MSHSSGSVGETNNGQVISVGNVLEFETSVNMSCEKMKSFVGSIHGRPWDSQRRIATKAHSSSMRAWLEARTIAEAPGKPRHMRSFFGSHCQVLVPPTLARATGLSLRVCVSTVSSTEAKGCVGTRRLDGGFDVGQTAGPTRVASASGVTNPEVINVEQHKTVDLGSTIVRQENAGIQRVLTQEQFLQVGARTTEPPSVRVNLTRHFFFQ